jgi:hypothetical protein
MRATCAMLATISAMTMDAMMSRSVTSTPRRYTCPSRIAD